MNVVVNGRFLSRPVTGVERYGQEILRGLAGRARVVRPPAGRQGAVGHAWEQLRLPGQIQPGEILWSPANTGPLSVAGQVLTLHDLSPLEHPGWFSPAFALWYRIFTPRLAQRVRRVVVPSEPVRRKALRRFRLPPERVAVVPGGVDLDRFRPGCPAPAGLPARYFLFVGSLQPRKNLAVLLQAWEQASPRFPEVWLLVAGASGRAFRRIPLPPASGRVRFLGYFPEKDLPGLYAGARALVIPSLDEGFGLPVLEAMACGTPVIASRRGALPALVGNAGWLFDPLQPSELAESLARGLADSDARRRRAEAGPAQARAFSWQESAEKMWEILQACR